MRNTKVLYFRRSVKSITIILAILFSNIQLATAVNLTWDAPTTRVDGSALATNQIARYVVYVKNSTAANYSGARTYSVGVANASITDLTNGSYRAVVTAVDTGSLESSPSNEVEIVVGAVSPTPTPTPKPPTTGTPTPTPTPAGPGVTPTPTPKPGVTPTPVGTQPPSGRPTPRPSGAAPTPTPDSNSLPDFNGDGTQDKFEYSRKTGEFNIELAGDSSFKLTGKLDTKVGPKMIGAGRVNGDDYDTVVYLKKKIAGAKTSFEWMSIDPYTGEETKVLTWGQLGDQPVFGCYDGDIQSMPALIRTLPNGKKQLLLKSSGKMKKVALPGTAAKVSCQLNSNGETKIVVGSGKREKTVLIQEF